MPSRNVSEATRANVDNFFADMDSHDKGEHKLGSIMSFTDVISANELRLGADEMKRVSAVAARDKRIEKYLPEIAVDLLYNSVGSPSSTLDANHDQYITKRELKAGSNDSSLTPIERRACEFAFHNFDKMRAHFEGEGGKFLRDSREISFRDVMTAREGAQEYVNAMYAKRQAGSLIRNFNLIDKDSSGTVSFNEVCDWRDNGIEANKPRNYDLVLPSPAGMGTYTGSRPEELSRDYLQALITKRDTYRSTYRQYWSIKE